MKHLLNELLIAEAKVTEIKHKIKHFNDGFIYLVCILSYGKKRWSFYTNQYIPNELCREYEGEQGFAYVYTNNINYQHNDAREIHHMTIEEIDKMSKDEVSMSQTVIDRLKDYI